MKISALESLFNLLVCVWIDWQSYMVKIMNIIKSYRMTNPIIFLSSRYHCGTVSNGISEYYLHFIALKAK